MNNWLCIKNNIVENIIVAEKNFTETNKDVLEKYDSFLNRDEMPEPQPVIGSYLENGKWVIKAPLPIAGTDFSNQDLTGRNFSHQDLSGCVFTGAIVDKTCFEWCKPTFSLVGAIWQGKTITQGPVMIDNPHYYTLLTDVALFVGCAESPTGVPLVSTDAEKEAYDVSKPGRPTLWWETIKKAYQAQVDAWAKP